MAEFERFAEVEFRRLKRKIARVYAQARQEIAEKMAAWTRGHEARDALQRERLAANKITKTQYQDWMRGQVFIGRQWQNQLASVSRVLVDADRRAAQLINHSAEAIFIENANHAAYTLEKDLAGAINFALYDTGTVARLVQETPELLPRRVINGEKAAAWQTRNISNAVTHGIIQGESIPQISQRIAKETGIQAGNASTRYARTAMTGAQNAGRQQRMEEAAEELEEDGIHMQKQWVATLDKRTREAHQGLDGQTVDVDEDFRSSLGPISYPGDPSANDANVYNCRCTLRYVYPQFKTTRTRRAYRTNKDGRRESYIVGDLTYNEWKKQKEGGE